jgi:FkbM family methyltransferase
MAELLRGVARPLVLDVGGNVGQSVLNFRRALPGCEIHSFEPSPETFERLKARCATMNGAHAHQLGVGSRRGELSLLENEQSDMTSFLKLGSHGWGQIRRSVQVPVTTLDDFTRDHAIHDVDVLKSDTQGYDFEVFKGASGLLSQGRVSLIYFEFTFNPLYEGLPRFEDVFAYLTGFDYRLVSLYHLQHQGKTLGWLDLLFASNRMCKSQEHAGR